MTMTAIGSRSGAVCCLWAGILVGGLAGCGPTRAWTFPEAQRLAAQKDKNILIYYKYWLSTECGMMQLELDRGSVHAALANTVLCVLDHDYLPNREVVSRYGVNSYPALILIEHGGEYRTHVGPLSAEQIVAFVNHDQSEATRAPAPQAAPALEPIEYQWHSRFDSAVRLGREQQKPVFVYYRSSTSDACRVMSEQVLNHPDVAGALEGAICCRLNWAFVPNRSIMAQYDIINVPGFVWINPDGSHQAHQGPLTADQLVKFVKAARALAR